MLHGWSIIQSFALNQNVANHWIVTKDGEPLDARSEMDREVAALFGALKSVPVKDDQYEYGIVEVATTTKNSVDPIILQKRNEYVDRDNRGRWGIAIGVNKASIPQALAVESGWELCEPLAAVLANFYGDAKPAQKPTAAEIERQKRKATKDAEVDRS